MHARVHGLIEWFVRSLGAPLSAFTYLSRSHGSLDSSNITVYVYRMERVVPKCAGPDAESTS